MNAQRCRFLQFVDDPAKGLSSISTWKALGFNTVPGDSASYATPPGALGGSIAGARGLLSPSNRTSSDWKGMKYGIMASPFGTNGLSAPPFGLGSIDALKMPVAAADSATATGFNFSRHGLTAAEEKAERTQWRNALQFYKAFKTIDISYNGYFKTHDFAVVTQYVNYSQPDYLTVDIESFPELEAWMEIGFKSANFASAKKSGESDSAASLRMAQSWLGGVAAAAKAARPDVKVYMYDIWARYDSGYQITSWPMAAAIGLADMPSYCKHLTAMHCKTSM